MGQRCYNTGLAPMTKISSMYEGESLTLSNTHNNMPEENQPPTPATDLTSSFASSAVALSWTAPTGYKL